MQTVILAIDYSKLHTFYKPLGIFSSYEEALEEIDGDELGGLFKFVLLEEYEVGSINSNKEGAIYQWVKGSKEWNRTATWKDGIG